MQELRVSELAAFVAATPAVTLLDVREAWELRAASLQLPGAAVLHIPMHLIPLRLAEIDGSHPVVCICHRGARSAQVVAFLLRQGWGAVYNLAGGIDAWSLQVDPSVPRY